MTSRLPNYLRAYRKRAALSQQEVAFLLGSHGGSKICRYEKFVREPTLETALALEIIFQKPVRDLFLGLCREVEQRILTRAKVLHYRTARHKTKGQGVRKHETVSKIVAACNGKKS